MNDSSLKLKAYFINTIYEFVALHKRLPHVDSNNACRTDDRYCGYSAFDLKVRADRAHQIVIPLLGERNYMIYRC